MKKSFVCSFCHNGVLGGGLYLTDSSLTYRTNKLTADPAYRNLTLPLGSIRALTWHSFLPIATFRMVDGRTHTFIIFNKSSFIKHYSSVQK